MQGGPNHVNNFCDAPILGGKYLLKYAIKATLTIALDATKQALTFQPTYYYMGHFSKFLAPGSIRINNACNGGLFCVAVLRPDNILVKKR